MPEKNTDDYNLSWTEKELAKEKRKKEKFNKKCKKELTKLRRNQEKEILNDINSQYNCKEKKSGFFDMSTMTKKLIVFIVINCAVIEAYSMFVMFYFKDLSTLEALMSAVISETVAFLIYCVKSYFETKAEKSNDLEYYKIDNQLDNNGNHENYIEPDGEEEQ